MATGGGQQQPADDSDPGTDPGPSHQGERSRRDALCVQHRLAGDCASQEQVHEGRGNAVIEAALDVDQPTDLGRYPLVAHDGGSQCGIRRGNDGAGQCGHPQPVAPEEQRRGGRAGRDGEGQADTEQSYRFDGGGAKLMGIDPGRIGEEDESQGDLGQCPHGRGVQVDLHHGDRTMGGQETQHHECDRSGDLPTLQAGGDETPEGQTAGDDRKCCDAVFVIHRSLLLRSRTSSTGAPAVALRNGQC